MASMGEIIARLQHLRLKERDALKEARAWFLRPENVDLNGSDRVYRLIDEALGTQYDANVTIGASDGH